MNLDPLFDQLRTAPAPEALDVLEPLVFAGIALQRERAVSRQGLMLAGAVSLVIGVATASFNPVREAQAAPMFGVPAAAPSHLLVG